MKKLFWVFALSGNIYFLQGIEGLPAQGLFYYLKETLNFSADKIMLIGSFTTFAWLVKPVIGYATDKFFDKKTWIFISLILSAILALILGLNNLPVFVIAGLLFLSSAGAAFRDVSVDGIMCQEGKTYNATGRIQSIQWISLSIAGLITGIAGGFIAEKWNYRMGFLCLIIFYLLAAIPSYFYNPSFFSSLGKGGDPRGIFSRQLFSELKKLFGDRRLMIVGLFIFLYKYSPSFGAPLFFIQRDTFKWSKVWIGMMGTIGIVFEIGGALLYYKFSRKIRIKRWLFFSVFLGAVIGLSYLYYTPASAVVYNILYGFIGMFIFLMIMDFMAKNTVNGLEATSFAFLCSISNLAQTLSNLSGAFLLPIIGLKWLIIISSLTNFLCLPLINKIKDI